jgi:hypothetical protein
MRRPKFDDQARIVAAIYAGQVIIFALGALYAFSLEAFPKAPPMP